MPAHTVNTGEHKLAIAKLDKTSYKKLVQSKKSVHKIAAAKSRLQLYNVNLKVNVPRPPRGVAVAK